jgi:type IV secretory pathway VirB4 component
MNAAVSVNNTTLVTGPAGSGKSALIAQWIASVRKHKFMFIFFIVTHP